MIESEWIDPQEEERASFLVVCTGNGRHEERTLAKFPVSRTWGVLASATPRGDLHGPETSPLKRKASYQLVYGPTGELTHRLFHCRRCEAPYLMPEAAFIALMEMLLAEAGGDLSARRVDLSTPGATLH